ncbi:MAG: hypothetical protein LBH48_02500 [Bifidobacteriaceae bacterium]|jgi:hypothetical protein|nr:hypothetical protein [Bifidobacteriaceae bacterium]
MTSGHLTAGALRRGIVGIGLVVAVVGTLMAGCSSGSQPGAQGDAPTTSAGSPATTAPELSEQGEIAYAFYQCLTDAGVPASFNRLINTDARVNLGEQGHDVLATIPDGPDWEYPGASGTIDPYVQSDFAAAHADSYGLLVDGEDRSQTLADCHEAAPYTEPNEGIDPDSELSAKRPYAEATNRWIACARQNGYPDMEDVPLTADSFATAPEVVLPLTMTPQELGELLAVCPNLSPDGPGQPDSPDPAVRIEAPAQFTDAEGAETEEAARFNELTEVLLEPFVERAKSLRTP